MASSHTLSGVIQICLQCWEEGSFEFEKHIVAPLARHFHASSGTRAIWKKYEVVETLSINTTVCAWPATALSSKPLEKSTDDKKIAENDVYTLNPFTD